MRVVRDRQMQLGEIGIAQIRFNLRSRDDIPKVLRGLQHLYLNEALREQVFTLLENEMAPGVDKHNGRPGMDCLMPSCNITARPWWTTLNCSRRNYWTN